MKETKRLVKKFEKKNFAGELDHRKCNDLKH